MSEVTLGDMATHSTTLLVVDDQELNRKLLSTRLESAGYRVRTASDGYKAIGIVQSDPIDLIVLDIMMPEIDGIQVVEVVRRTHDATQLPIIMASALDDSDVIVRALDAGANDYVTKPIDFPILLARVQAQLRLAHNTPRQNSGPSPREIGSGTVLAGRYRLGEVLGSGGFGSVYRARHLELDFDVAVKLLHPHLLEQPDVLKRFRREGISACRVQHPNAVSIYDFQITDSGAAYLVMEFMRGTTLGSWLSAHGPLTPATAVSLMLPICDVLDVAHAAGVIHRDIKAENIMLQETTAGELVKVLDFGIAGICGEDVTEVLTEQGGVLGTPAYTAPERFFGSPADSKADVYSLAVLLWLALTGNYPFRASKYEDLMRIHSSNEMPEPDDSLSSGVTEALLSALEPKPDERPSAQEFAAKFRAAVESND
jgi:CheY-like chemotaxis protein